MCLQLRYNIIIGKYTYLGFENIVKQFPFIHLLICSARIKRSFKEKKKDFIYERTALTKYTL